MQPSCKEQILKLLNLDQMITQYLHEPKLNRKTPANNKKQKYQRQHELSQKLCTVQVSSNIRNNRTCSSSLFTRKTIDPNTETNKKGVSLTKTYSSKINRQNTMSQNSIKTCKNGQYATKPCNSTKIFKNNCQFLLNQHCELAESVRRVMAKDRKSQNQSTNQNILEQQNKDQQLHKEQTRKCISKSRIKLKIPKPITEQHGEKSGTVLKGRYQLEKVIGRGLSGQVYKAKDILSNRYVAIKIIDPKNIEYQFIKQIEHPNMIKYYNSFLENGRRYLVLEFLPHTLSQIIRVRKLQESQVRKVFKSIASGLMYLHSLSYAHRDIKLDNLVTNEELSVVKFIDFGLCVDTSQVDSKQKKRFCGTTTYMAPQIISGKCGDPKKADIWSLGVALYILFVRRNPFKGKMDIQVFKKIKNNKTLFPNEMPQQLKNLLQRMLSKNPEERPSIIEVINSSWLNQ